MVANIGPADWNFDETLSTLRYANRAKNIKNKPRINEDPKDAMLREYQQELERLKKQLEDLADGGGDSGAGGDGEGKDAAATRVCPSATGPDPTIPVAQCKRWLRRLRRILPRRRS